LEFLSNYLNAEEFEHQQHMVAAITKKNDIIGVGKNQMKTHPFQAKFSRNPDSIYLHAETAALLDAINNGIDPTGGVMHVIRRLKNNTLGLARPCNGCMKALDAYGINKIVYSNELGTFSSETRD